MKGWISNRLTHGGVRLGDSTSHSSEQTTDRRVESQTRSRRLDLGSGEEQDGTLRRGLDPSLTRNPIQTDVS